MPLPKETWRPPRTRQPGPRRRPGALSKKAISILTIRLQTRPTMSISAIPAGLTSNDLKMAVGIFFIHSWLAPDLRPILAYRVRFQGGQRDSLCRCDRNWDDSSVTRVPAMFTFIMKQMDDRHRVASHQCNLMNLAEGVRSM